MCTLRHFAEGHPVLQKHLRRISWTEIALPSIAVAEVLRGRCEFALKATPIQAPLAHHLLMETRRLLDQFNVIVFDQVYADELMRLQRASKTR